MATLDLPERPEIRRLSAEQSNSSLIVGDAVVLKIVRRVSAGIHPEGEITRVLTERGFGNTAPLFGEVVRVAPDGTPHTLMIVQGFVRNQGDGGGWTLDYLARVGEDLVADTGGDSVDAAFGGYAVFASNLGRRLAELHAVLSEPTDDPAFAPEVADELTLDGWADGAREQLGLAMGLLRRQTGWPDQQTEALADQLLAQEAALRDVIGRLARSGRGALNTRVHGDFHLGQVLVVQGDAYLIDFEGEPARSLAQRRAKSSPLRDVAGLLRSFDYAAAAAAPGRTANSPGTEGRRLALLSYFQGMARRAFLDAYRAVLREAPHAWVPPSSEAALLDLFLIEKAAYEIRYEAENRPTWLSIPLEGLAAIAGRVLSRELVS
jgi:maltose alpha-D-glucosyltransferase/alpha-amylase